MSHTPDDPPPPVHSRRALLAAAALSPLGMHIDLAAMTRVSPLTFVLVHGGWHGGWCWKTVAPLLREKGHVVYTPTLTGLGERSHLLNPDIGLDTHVRDVAATLEYEDLQDVVMVGHSYGGMVVSGVAASDASVRLAHLIYLDAFLPEPGKAVQDYAPVPPAKPDGWRVPPPGSARQFGVSDADEAAWVSSRLGDQPRLSFTQPVPTNDTSTLAVRRTFLRCTDTPWFSEAAERAKRLGFDYHELRTGGHDAMLSVPVALASLLISVAQAKSPA